MRPRCHFMSHTRGCVNICPEETHSIIPDYLLTLTLLLTKMDFLHHPDVYNLSHTPSPLAAKHDYPTLLWTTVARRSQCPAHCAAALSQPTSALEAEQLCTLPSGVPQASSGLWPWPGPSSASSPPPPVLLTAVFRLLLLAHRSWANPVSRPHWLTLCPCYSLR